MWVRTICNVEKIHFAFFPFLIWKMMLWKCCTQYASKFGKLSSGHRTGKGQFSFQSQRKANAKECSNYHTIALISHSRKVMLKILQSSLQQYMNEKLPGVQVGFRKGKGARDQIANVCWIIEKAREFQKNIDFCFIEYTETSDLLYHNKLWKILQELWIPHHLICPLRNLYAGQEATVRTGHGTTDRFQIGKGVRQSVYFHPAYSTCEMQGWMKHKLESRLLGERSIT